jgi:hypothetical protein
MFIASVRGRTSAELWGARGALVALAVLTMCAAFAAPAHAASTYVFTRVAASTDGFDQNTLQVSCPSINNRGDIAFKSSRGGVDGIYRANAGGTVTTIAEVGTDVGTDEIVILANGNPSMNDSGQVSFGASLSDGSQAILRGDGTLPLTVIARTSTQRMGFASFEDNTSINNAGEVAFDGRRGSGARGLFSGTGGAITTHYLNTADAGVDGSPARFDAIPGRPSINDLGDIAFRDSIQETFRQDIFRGQEGNFTTISAANPPQGLTPPLLNNGGTVAWQTSFLDENGFFASAIVTGDGDGPDTTVVDSSGAFDVFDSFALNNAGAVAFSAILDSDNLGIPSIFVGPDPKKDRVIGPGDKLDGGTVAGLRFCEEGLNDSGQLAFVADIEDRNGDVRTGVFRATLRR